MIYRFLADAVLVLHLAVVLFVILGLVAILIGNQRACWDWVNRPGFRLAHLGAIVLVALQAWLGQDCPLTTLESWLRVQSGALPYEKGFIEHWVQWLIFYRAPSWVFSLIYTGFALLVGLVWIAYPPGKRGRHGCPRGRR